MPVVVIVLLQIILPALLALAAAWFVTRHAAPTCVPAPSWIAAEAERGIHELEAHLRRVNRRRGIG